MKITITEEEDRTPRTWSIWADGRYSGYVILTLDGMSLVWKGAWISSDGSETVVRLTTPPSFSQAVAAARELVLIIQRDGSLKPFQPTVP